MDVFETLRAAANPEKAAEMAAYMRGQFAFLGLPTPVRKKLTRRDVTDTGLLERIIANNLGQTEFFINKAIGWALRDYSKTNPDWVRDFVARHRDQMAPLSIREASKYL